MTEDTIFISDDKPHERLYPHSRQCAFCGDKGGYHRHRLRACEVEQTGKCYLRFTCRDCDACYPMQVHPPPVDKARVVIGILAFVGFVVFLILGRAGV